MASFECVLTVIVFQGAWPILRQILAMLRCVLSVEIVEGAPRALLSFCRALAACECTLGAVAAKEALLNLRRPWVASR